MATGRYCAIMLVLLACVGFNLAAAQTTRICGDPNGDGEYNVADAVYMINYVFKGGPPPDSTCCDECTDGQQVSCYSGPPETEGIGVCLGGLRLCVGGTWSEECVGEVIPSTEICDGLDNDCDGTPDNDLTPIPCDLTQGVCAGAVRACGGAEGWLPCDASNYGPDYEPVEVTCDGLDNDCNGVTDEMCEEAPHVDWWTCDSDTCIIGGCETGYADDNGIYADGCESPAHGYCLIDGIAYYRGDPNPGNDCEYCDPDVDQYGWVIVDCDDDNVCTNDACVPGSGCQFSCNNSPCELPHASAICSGCECTVSSCESNWANCDGYESNGCEEDLAYTPLDWYTAENLGTFDGDECTGCETDYVVHGRGSHWYYVYMLECCSNPIVWYDVGVRVTLSSPTNMDYDLYLWDGSYSNVLIGSSTNGAGLDDSVEDCPNDQLGTDDSRYYVIEIRAHSGSSCQNWTLRIQSCP